MTRIVYFVCFQMSLDKKEGSVLSSWTFHSCARGSHSAQYMFIILHATNFRDARAIVLKILDKYQRDYVIHDYLHDHYDQAKWERAYNSKDYWTSLQYCETSGHQTEDNLKLDNADSDIVSCRTFQ